MNREELNNYLYELRANINKDNAEKIFVLLESIFKIKPVTILYFNVKAKLLCEVGRYEEAVEILKGKMNLCFPDEEYINSCEILKNAYKAMNRETFYRQYCCLEYYLREKFGQDEESLINFTELEKKIIELEDKFLKSLSNTEIEMELSDGYFESWNITEATIMYAIAIKDSNNDFKSSLSFTERIVFEANYNFLLEQLLYKNATFILVANEDNNNRCNIIAMALNKLKQKVYIIMPPVLLEVQDSIELSNTLSISMSNLKVDENGISRIIPFEYVHKGNIVGNNTYLILENLSKNTKNDFSFLLGTGIFFAELNKISSVKKRMQRLSNFKGDSFENNFVFGYFGKYTSYISSIYGLDVESEIQKPSECEFSIVIPVRNAGEYLRYTLQTCLKQRGIKNSDYEIVVSDNSTLEYMGVENLVKEINDSRIKYFRTPRELPLNRSFEYAFLKAKGEFVFSIGADDAVLPWGLQVIREALKILPSDDIIQWDRGFFVWPNNDKISAQAGQFLIPRSYRIGDIQVEIKQSIEEINRVLTNPNEMYAMPMLYINSGFRRNYINKILEDTGRLWDGVSQDIYMGVLNLLINKTIPWIQYPITIAGMTATSAGITANIGNNDNQAMINRMLVSRMFGVTVPYGKCLKFLDIDLDIANFYSSFFRVLELDEKGMVENIARQIDWKKVFEKVAMGLSCNDLSYDINIKSLRYSAYYHSEEMGKWFDDNVLNIIMLPKTVGINDQKAYAEGFIAGGGLQLDARKFDVNNVYEATKLFEKICNL